MFIQRFAIIYLKTRVRQLKKERIVAGLLYSVGDAVNARIEYLFRISVISSRWSEVLYFSDPIKRKHGW